MSDSKSSKGKWIALGVIVIALFASWFLLPVKEWLETFNEWIKGLGVWGGVIYAAIYIIATVVLAPASLLTIVGGLAFGIGIGFPLAAVSATIGATLAFLVARYLLRDKVAKMVESRPKFKAVDKAVSEDGWKVVMLLRLSPLVPFNLQNYFYGITDIKFWHYVPATLIGILPGTLLYVYLGAAGKAALGGEDGGGSSGLKWGFFAVGLIATIVVAVIVTRKAKAKLNELGVDEKQK